MKYQIGLAIAALLVLYAKSACAQEPSIKAAPLVHFCEVVSNPAAYDGKVISIRAKVSREFEDFTLFDANCYHKPDIWIWLGGDSGCKTKWEAMDFSCTPGNDIKFRGVEYPMVEDDNMKNFVRLLAARQDKKPVYRVTATLTGTFFGENPKQPAGLRVTLPGYGHMGCCFQLIVNHVSRVAWSSDVQDRHDEWKLRSTAR